MTSNGSKATFKNNKFCGNYHIDAGIGTNIYAEGVEISFDNNTFSNNDGRALVYLSSCHAKSISNNIFYNNTSTGQDGTAYFFEGEHDLSGVTISKDYVVSGDRFYGNTAQAGPAGAPGTANGGVVFAKAGASLVFRNAIFIGNKTTQLTADGAAINALDLKKLEIDNCYFKNNETVRHGGAIAATNTPVLVSNSTFIGNKTTGLATRGGAIRVQGNTFSSSSSIYKNNEAIVQAELYIMKATITLPLPTINTTATLPEWKVL